MEPLPTTSLNFEFSFDARHETQNLAIHARIGREFQPAFTASSNDAFPIPVEDHHT